jgi:hypothetical protein
MKIYFFSSFFAAAGAGVAAVFEFNPNFIP